MLYVNTCIAMVSLTAKQ